MLLVVGLGNPGREHEEQRHNVGFMVADALQGAEGWPAYKSKLQALWTRGELGGRPVVVLKPQTYMNLSGDSVQPAAAFLQVEPRDIVVVHDELDLPWLDVRIKVGGGHAGHNGVRSIQQRLGTPEFARVRVGIGKPPTGFGGGTAGGTMTGGTMARGTMARAMTAEWVLSGWGPAEREELPAVILRAADAVRRIAVDGLAVAMNVVHTKR